MRVTSVDRLHADDSTLGEASQHRTAAPTTVLSHQPIQRVSMSSIGFTGMTVEAARPLVVLSVPCSSTAFRTAVMGNFEKIRFPLAKPLRVRRVRKDVG